jgi:predicted nucleic acid-binding protein
VIVLDASVVVDFLLGGVVGEVEALLKGQEAAAPHLLDAEVGQVIRRFVLRGDLTEERALACLDDYRFFPLQRYPHVPLLERAFELRDRVTFYDALYLALGEALRATVVTRDKALAKQSDLRTRVLVV